MDRFARIVLGYHGCSTTESVDFARRLFDATARVAEWRPSDNSYDWLGRGMYFWEHGPGRAAQWAGENGRVVGAVIQLGRCFDLTDLRYTGLLRTANGRVVDSYQKQGLELPKNEGRSWKLRKLDCLIINRLMKDMDHEFVASGDEAFRFQTVRCPFEEGDDAFPGSMLKTQTHIQISVRDPSCILGVFRPNL